MRVSVSAALSSSRTPTATLRSRTADAPVSFSQLHLDQPGGTLSPGTWSITGPTTCSTQLQPPGTESTTSQLTESAQGDGLFGLSWGPNGIADLQGTVLQTPSDELALDLSAGSSGFTESLTLTGYGTTFTGSAKLSGASCTYSTTGAKLTLDGTGLTACLSPISSSVATPLSRRAHASRAPMVTTAPACKLDVAIAAPKSFASGLTNHKPGGGVTFFDGAANTCTSGCANITVTVTDPSMNGAAVVGAKVNLSLGATDQADIAAYPGGKPEAYMCSQGHCDRTSLTGLVTDQNGQVHVLFWSPGLIHPDTNRFVVRAFEDCTGQSGSTTCTQKQGFNFVTMKVIPNTFLDVHANLSPEETAELIAWAGGTPSARLTALSKGLGREGLIKALESNLEAAEAEGGAAVVKWAGVFLGAILEGLEFHEALGAMEMLFTKFGIPGVGLGYTAKDIQQVAAGPRASFVDAFVGSQHLGVGPTGVVYKYAQVLADDDKARPIDGSQQVHMKIYDVSYCPFGVDCSSYPGSDIVSYLYFQMWSTQDESGEPINGWHFSLLTSYQANAWTMALDNH